MATNYTQVCLIFSIIALTFVSTSANPGVYIVHMDLSAMPTSFSGRHDWFLSTVASVSDKTDQITTTTTTTATKTTSSSKLIYSYSHVMHGFCASLTGGELEKLKGSLGYISATRDIPVKPDTTHTSQFLGLNSNSGAWPEGRYGEDVIIGLVDTGVWPESASFNDDGFSQVPSRWKGGCEAGFRFDSSMCNKKLIGARYFNNGIVANNPNITIAMNSTRDTDGHGTHTSTTAAGSYVQGASYFGYASGTARGMAPKARVAMYKALWEGGAVTSDIIAAIDQAITDGVDVLSLSLGLDGVPFYLDPVAIATFAALEKGIFVTTSAGNEGPYIGSIHNGTPWVLTVGAGTLDREFGGAVTLGNGVTIAGASLYPGNATSLNRVPIVFLGQCDNPKALKKAGYKIVVCKDTNDTLSEQVSAVRSANVAGGIFVTNNTDVEFFVQSSFPATFVSFSNGAPIIDYIGSTKSKSVASIEFRKTMLGTSPAPRVASYSSRGPSASSPFVLKPDLIAPGEFILAAWPQSTAVTIVGTRQVFSDFNLLSGTSMSCPHVAGVAALLKSVHPDWSPAAIRSALMTTSSSTDNTLSPITDAGYSNSIATPWAMGSGHVDPNKALDPGLVYDAGAEDYVSLLCAMNYTTTQIRTVTRSPPDSFNCSTNSSLDLNYPSFIAYFNGDDTAKGSSQTVREFQRTVTNVGKDTTTYAAKLTRLVGFEFSVVPDKLVFSNKYQKLSYKLSIKGPSLMNETLAFSYLSWVDIDGHYVVKSPIVATRLSSDALPAKI